ncbi:MAG: GGDEF domain-containing protein [Bacilli bacterium]|nr:GGDEF domain-containing protein [Bacilli bacterium]
MKESKEKELLFLVIIFIIIFDVSFIFSNIRSTIFYSVLIGITIICLGAIFHIIVQERIKKEKEIETLLYYDKVTKLPNKNKFLNDIPKTIKNKEKYAVIVFDMRDFKELLDDIGLTEVNKFLKNIASIIKKETKSNELCSNISDDHFALLYEYKKESDLEDRIKSINKQIKEYDIKQKITLSFGIYPITDKRFSSTLMFNKASLARKEIVDKKNILFNFYKN